MDKFQFSKLKSQLRSSRERQSSMVNGQSSTPQGSRELAFAVGEAGANLAGKFESAAAMVNGQFSIVHHAMLQYACYRLGNIDDAEDAVQDVFVKLHQKQSEDAAEIKNLSAYLYRTLANICVSRLREAARRPTVPIDTQPEPIAVEAEDFEQEYRRISRLLAMIPEEQAEVIRLRYYGDKSFPEIAEILDIPLTTAKSRFQYGIEKIRIGMIKNQ